jgi:Co/Zn/Cd efflux system component
MLEAHIDFENDVRISEFEKFHKQVRTVLKNHHINHITLQPEFSSDCDKGIIGHGDC